MASSYLSMGPKDVLDYSALLLELHQDDYRYQIAYCNSLSLSRGQDLDFGALAVWGRQQADRYVILQAKWIVSIRATQKL